MCRKINIEICFLFIFVLMTGVVNSQELKVTPLKISTSYSELAPNVHDSVLYFISNRKSTVLVNVFNQDEEHLYKLYKAPLLKDGTIGRVTPFEPDPGRKLSEGPIAFSPKGDFFIATMNRISSLREAQRSGDSHQLSLYKVPLSGRGVQPAEELPLNIEGYSIGHPSLSSDGQQLFFISNKPGGYGETDIYVSQRSANGWGQPVNLGEVINTAGRELFPFYHPSGKLYFSSDGHGGYGGLDIFYSVFNNGSWSAPIPLEPPINSPFDDFSCYIFPDEISGFIASARDGADNLYSFRYELAYCENPVEVVEDYFCFTFFEERAIVADTIPVKYRWEFSDGHSALGVEVDHCFPGPGFYEINLSVIDSISDEELYAVANYEILLEKTKQVYFNLPDIVKVGEPVTFSATLNGFGDDPQGVQYFWDTGEGDRRLGVTISHIFRKRGIFTVSCEAYFGGETICSYRTVVVE